MCCSVLQCVSACCLFGVNLKALSVSIWGVFERILDGGRASLSVYKALLCVHRALLSVYRALLSVSRALLSVYRALSIVAELL